MLNIIVSFDYELFLGENYDTPKRILFEPTENLMNLLEKYNVSSTFFADVCSIFAHKKYNLFEYVDDFSNQLINIKKRGHDVQLHLHPNWYYSIYDGDKWIFDTLHYTLHKFPLKESSNEKLTMGNIIKEGVKYLNELLLPIDQSYRVNTFRAGGYSMQPHSSLIKHLREEGIIIDSSVCANLFSNSKTLSYDYRKIPKTINWWLTPNYPFLYCGKKNDGGVYEIPLLSEKNSIFRKLFLPGYDKKFRTSSLKGSYISLGEKQKNENSIFKKIKNYKSSYALVSFDSMPSDRMIHYLLSMEKKYKNKDLYISIICHPKLVDDGVLSNMENIFSSLCNNSNIKFCNFQDVVDKINKGIIH